MTGQLAHPITATSLPTVQLGIIPLDTSRTRWPVEGFWIFDDTAVNVELVSGCLTITAPPSWPSTNKPTQTWRQWPCTGATHEPCS